MNQEVSGGGRGPARRAAGGWRQEAAAGLASIVRGPSAPPRRLTAMSYGPLDAVQNDNIVNTWLHRAIKI